MEVKINGGKCKEIGLAFKEVKLPEFPKIENLEKERFLWFIHTVICHQINSDYLEKVLRRENLNNLEKISAKDIKKWLNDYDKPERIRAEERSDLIRNAVKVLNEKFGGSVDGLLKKSDFDVEKLYKNLKLFKAFAEDPLEKKLSVFVHLLFLNSLADLKNLDQIKPVVDYHIQRAGLRNGRIIINDRFKEKIIKKIPITLEEDTEIRKAMIEALKLTAKAAGKNIAELNYLEWQNARNICQRKNPGCLKCPLNQACEKKIELLEPVFKSSFY